MSAWLEERRLKHDSRQSFLEEIERAYGRGLRRFIAARMRRACADVPDLVQEVFLRLLRVEDYASIRNPQAYLYTMASHVMHQHLVRKSLTGGEAQLHDPELSTDLRESAQADPAVEIELEQRFEVIARGLEEVSPRAYATLIMCRCEGMPLKEIARRLGVSHSMAKKYLAQALSYSQRKLQEME